MGKEALQGIQIMLDAHLDAAKLDDLDLLRELVSSDLADIPLVTELMNRWKPNWQYLPLFEEANGQ